MIHVSTDYVFDGAGDRPWIETDAPDPHTVYGRTKLAGEQAVAAAGGRHAILRTSWVFAPEGKNFVRTMLRLAQTRDRIAVVDDQVGHPTYAPFIAEAILAVARRMVVDVAAPSGVYRMVGEGVTSWRGFADAIFEVSRERGGPFASVDPVPTSGYPTPARRPLNSRMDPSKLAREHGVSLPHWRKGLSDCLDAVARGGWKVG
jgi:dTDP-4-dehydrorhamnose reductase